MVISLMKGRAMVDAVAYLTARLKEPSSQAVIAMILYALHSNPALFNTIMDDWKGVASLVAAIGGILVKESGSTAPPSPPMS